VNIDNFHGRFVFEMLPEFGDVHIHTAGIEIVVVDPD
jgi:hypothetical protein